VAIPSEIGNFSSEDDFVQRFLIPMLFRMGFSVVANYHGKREQGKDLVFGEIDRFGHVLYYGLQAKYEKSIPSSMVQGMVDDVQSAFANPFTHPQTNKQEVITRFYYVNAGSFSEYVPDDFFNRIDRWKRHTVILDGPALLMLNRWAALNRTVLLRELLSGLILETRWNRSASTDLNNALPKRIADIQAPAHIVRYRLSATLAYLERPPVPSQSMLTLLERYWFFSNSANYILDSADVPIGEPWIKARLEAALPMIASADEYGQHVENVATKLLNDLGALPL
jgi:hypothetical protein